MFLTCRCGYHPGWTQGSGDRKQYRCANHGWVPAAEMILWLTRHEEIPLVAHGSKLFQRERMPTVSEIVEVIRTMPYEVEQCFLIQRGQPSQPLKEIWIEVMGVWANFDGSRYSADYARGHARPGFFDAWRLRRAIRGWCKRNRVEWLPRTTLLRKTREVLK